MEFFVVDLDFGGLEWMWSVFVSTEEEDDDVVVDVGYGVGGGVGGEDWDWLFPIAGVSFYFVIKKIDFMRWCESIYLSWERTKY